LKTLAAAVCTLALAASARGDDTPPPPAAIPRRPTTFAERLVSDMRSLVDAAIVARPPKLTPPKPIARAWKLTKLATVDLGSPLATLAAADLDGDGKGELYAVTATTVVAYGVAPDKKLKELGRVAFSGDRPSITPRDVVATATYAPVEPGVPAGLVASVSTFARNMRVHWVKGVLTGVQGDSDFLVCPGEHMMLTPGRNYFGDALAGAFAMQCTTAVDGDGYPLRIRARLAVTNKLDIGVERCAATDFKCMPAARHEYSNVGAAFDITDVDRNGTPEVVYAAAGAPGDPDTLRVVSLGDDDKKPRFKKAFTAGGIAGIATTDLDGDHTPDTIVALRLVGASRVDLWRIE
jgi:hypothetical protein